MNYKDGRFSDNMNKYPFVETHNVWDNLFQFIIANEQGESWYSLKNFPDPFWQEWAPDLRALINEGDTIIDCGAHHGHYTLAFAKTVEHNGEVIAIEADPYNYQILKENIALNQLPITALNRAIYDEDNQMLDIQAEVIRGPGQIPSITIDSIPHKNPVSLIKIDIEGLEVRALRGAKQTLIQDRPIISIDIHLCGSVDGVDMRDNHQLYPSELQSIIDKLKYTFVLNGQAIRLSDNIGMTLRAGTFLIPNDKLKATLPMLKSLFQHEISSEYPIAQNWVKNGQLEGYEIPELFFQSIN